MYGLRAAGDIATLDVAFLARVSDEDLQDPTLSIPRQLSNAQAVLPPGWRIVAHFWDVESGRKSLDTRGRSRAHERFDVPVPRDGGIADLLAEARSPRRRFDAVLCESIDRVARRTHIGTKIEHDLEQSGVLLLAADEGVTNLRKRATAILTRRVKQATAEWYVLETLEKAWDGFCEHATQGWNIGTPPYGYLADSVPHPIPAKRADGLHKTRLAPDPVRGPVVETIFTWRVVERLSYQEIANRLNADKALYPPPVANVPARTRGSWSAASVRTLLTNPKYTGHMVWNRRARNTGGARHNDPSQWVWSPEPTHQPLVSLDTWRQAQAMTRQGSRSSGDNRNPTTKRTYLLRSYIVCARCQRRMEGDTRRKNLNTYTYYACRPARNLGPEGHENFPGHARNYFVREDHLLAGILDFLAERVFGPHRRNYLADDFRAAATAVHAEWHQRITNLETSIADIAARRERLAARLEEEDDRDLIDDIRARHATLAQQHKTLRAELADLRGSQPPNTADDPSLLELLGTVSRDDLAAMNREALRALFDKFALTVTYEPETGYASLTVTLTDYQLPDIDQALATVLPFPTRQPHTDAPDSPQPAPTGNANNGFGMFAARSAAHHV